MRISIVTGRLLQRRLGLDAGDEVFVVDKVVEERMPGFGGDAGVPEYFFQFVNAIIGQGGEDYPFQMYK